MINDIWYHVFHFVTDHKDVFNIAFVDTNFNQLIQKQYCCFPWFKFHRLLQNFGNEPNKQRGKELRYYFSTKMGLIFKLYQRESKIFLLVTDYLQQQREIQLSFNKSAKLLRFIEFVNNSEILMIYDKTGHFYYLFNLMNHHPSLIYNSSLSNTYCYKIKVVASLTSFDEKIDKYRIIGCGLSAFHRSPIIIFIDKYCKIHNYASDVIRMRAHEENGQTQIICSYHTIPLKYHRIFVAQFNNQIFFIDLTILNARDADVKVCILHTLIDNKYSSDNYLIDFLSDQNILRIIKNWGNNLTIVKELKFYDSLQMVK
jgi:hypothetical protein